MNGKRKRKRHGERTGDEVEGLEKKGEKKRRIQTKITEHKE